MSGVDDDDYDRRRLASFVSVLPHDPLPQKCNVRGYVQLQGSFVPKCSRRRRTVANDDVGGGECGIIIGGKGGGGKDEDDDDDATLVVRESTRCACREVRHIESTILSNLRRYMTVGGGCGEEEGGETTRRSGRGGISGLVHDDFVSVVVVLSSSSSSSSSAIMDDDDSSANIGKVRVITSSPRAARIVSSRLRRMGWSPGELLRQHHAIEGEEDDIIDEGGCECRDGVVAVVPARDRAGGGGGGWTCPFGCGGRYSGRAMQVSQVVPHITPERGGGDGTNATATATATTTTTGGGGDDVIVARWARAAPPKFRKLQRTISDPSTGNSGTSCDVISPDVELMEHRRSVTRFLYLENVASSSNVTMAKYPTVARRDASGGDDNIYADDDDDDGDDDISTSSMIKDLMSIFRGAWSPGTDDGCDVDALAMRMIDDDVRHAYQDAMRDAIASAVHTTDDGNEHFDGSGVELFMMPSDAMPSPGKKARGMGPRTNGGCVDDGVCGDGHHHDDGIDRSSSGVYDRMHIGMRDNRDAAMLIRKWQGKRVSLSMRLPVSFVDRYRSVGGVEYFSVNILTGKLFLDYADVLLPKGRHRCGVPRGRDDDVPPPARSTSFGGIGGGVGEPSRPECTSATDHIHIPGLTLIKNYTSEDEERVLMAALSGPHAPWAPAQSTPSGGVIRRRVQHYGYVFDYASADVLRRDDVGVDHEECNDERIEIHSPSACPPMPSICSSGHSASDMSDGDLEGYIDRAVRDVRGWEALAGIIERTRRFVFDVSSSCHPHVNQLTVNEYIPGQGIGSHIDSVTAFDDGILMITLNGGIVMEFRKVIDDDTSSRTINPNERSSCKYNSDEPPMKNVQERKLVYLPPRSLMLLSGDARYKWEHMIVSRTTDTVEGVVLPRKLRVSLTLRTALSRQVKKELRHPVIASPLPHYETCVFPPQWGQLSDAAAAAAANTVPPKHNGNENQTTTPGSHSSAGNRSDLVTPATERKHVHTVYDAIATQWHHTRGKRGVLWPGATQFLENLPKGSIVADVGCGDGKYFTAITAASSYVIGTDISEPLLKTAAAATEEGHTTVDGPHYQRLSTEKRALSLRPAVAVADCIHLPLRSQSFDAAICIAVMHHLSTEGRRIRCLAELRRIVKVGGLINVQAWALEQEDDSKRKFHGTDVLVPFNAQPKYLLNKLSDANGECWNFQTTVVDAPSIGKGVAQMVAEKYTGAEFDSKKNLVVFQRYCHMYRRGELEQLCLQVPGLMVLESSYEKGNHVVLLIVT